MMNLFKVGAALFATAFGAIVPQGPIKDVKDLEGKPLPSFQMISVDGKHISNSTLKGHAAVIDFWATWCGPCMKASPVMQGLHEEYKGKGLLVIGANGYEESTGPDAAKNYSKKHGYHYVFTHSNDTLMKNWGISGIPTIIFVDKSGNVAKVQVGFSEKSVPAMKKLALELVSARQ